MYKKAAGLTLITALFVGSLFAHDMFLKFSSYFLEPDTDATIALINGTFDKSENAIARDRMLDVSIVGPAKEVTHPDLSHWWEKDNTTWLDFQTGEAGTYVIGVSTAARDIELSAEDFNTYLEHDGVMDVLEARKKAGTLDEPALELYSKHVKAIYQVGDTRSSAYSHILGYPIEIVPRQNPYDLQKGDALDVLVLRNGKPVANQLVYASHAGYHGHDDTGAHIEAVTTRTDEAGMAHIELNEEGVWYVRLIHMVEHPDPKIDYESNWATLTFEIASP